MWMVHTSRGAAVRPVLMYACKTWPLRVNDKKTAINFWPLVLPLYGKRRHLQFGNVLRRPETEMKKKSLLSSPYSDWKCQLDGQIKTRVNTMKADMARLGLQWVFANGETRFRGVQTYPQIAMHGRLQFETSKKPTYSHSLAGASGTNVKK